MILMVIIGRTHLTLYFEAYEVEFLTVRSYRFDCAKDNFPTGIIMVGLPLKSNLAYYQKMLVCTPDLALLSAANYT